MTKRDALIQAAIGGLLVTGALALTTQASAQEANMDKCYGVVKAGKNDCAGPGHTCQGKAVRDADPQEFLLVPAGTCEKLANGSLTAKAPAGGSR